MEIASVCHTDELSTSRCYLSDVDSRRTPVRLYCPRETEIKMQGEQGPRSLLPARARSGQPGRWSTNKASGSILSRAV